MSRNMYAVAGDCPGNEDLALQIQTGDRSAAELLVSRNEGYLTDLARNYSAWCELEDLKQEGAMALLAAAERFDPSYGTKLLTYATPAIEAAMADCAARSSFSLSVPSSRYDQLRRVGYVLAQKESTPDASPTEAVCEALGVSPKVAEDLLAEYRTVFQVRQLGDDVFGLRGGADPAKLYDQKMRRVLLLRLIEETLSPRERTLVRCYLGLEGPYSEGMTFQELAVRLNYNGHSGAEKSYKAALRKLRKQLYTGAYGQWLSIQKAIREARAQAEAGSGCYSAPQTTWWDEKEQAERFLGEVTALVRVYEVLCGAEKDMEADGQEP